MDNIKINKNGNAIEQVVFVFVLSEPFTDTMINDIMACYKNDRNMVENELPRMQLQNAITIQVGNQSSTPSPSLGGVIFDKLFTNGKQEWFVNFSNNIIIIGSSQYTRWDDIWNKAKEYLEFFSKALNKCSIKEIGIEYIDEFKIIDPLLDWKNELFCQDSDLLPLNIWKLKDFWHVHQGYFSNIEDHKQLNNININYLKDEQNDANKVIIQSHHKIILNSTLGFENEQILSNIDTYMQKNHIDNKKVMCDLFSTSLCEAINLKCVFDD